jgi:hypothetical protein
MSALVYLKLAFAFVHLVQREGEPVFFSIFQPYTPANPNFYLLFSSPHSLLRKKISYLTSCSKMSSFGYLLKGEHHFLHSLAYTCYRTCWTVQSAIDKSWHFLKRVSWPKGFPKPVQTELAFAYGCDHPRMSRWALMHRPHNVQRASSLGSPAYCYIYSTPCIFVQAINRLVLYRDTPELATW